MASVTLSGLPNTCKLPKLVVVLKSRIKSANFWIKEMADIRGTDLKSARIEFDSANEAYRALKVLNGFEYVAGQFSYPISVRIDEDRGPRAGRPRRRSPSPYNYRSRDREYRDRYEEASYSRYDDYARERSRSPVHQETSKLDLEIELLRKQRMIIEEERRLLLERKKLELVKEFGPSALKEFKSFEDDRDRDRRYRPERAVDYRPRRRSPPPPPRPRANAKPAQQPWQTKKVQLPQFILPCKILLGELNELMEKLGTRKESFLLTKLIRATIRKRIAVALEGKPIMSGAKIVALYREKYPSHLDEDFVTKHLKEVRACHMPSKGNDNKETVKKAEENDEKVDEAKEGQENNGVDEKVDTDSNLVAGDIKVKPDESKLSIKEEVDTSTETQVLEGQDEPAQNTDQAEIDRAECNRSVGSSEALTLHDKNDEDWVEGEHGWDDGNEQTTQQ